MIDTDKCLHCVKHTGHKSGVCLDCRKRLGMLVGSGSPKGRKRKSKND